MPVYGYRCQECAREFEVLQRMTDPPAAACPDCGGAGTRLFYPAGILFKGSGFYKTDSRSNGKPSGAAAPTESGGGDAGKAAPAAPSKTPGGGDGAATSSTPAASPAPKTTTATKPPG